MALLRDRVPATPSAKAGGTGRPVRQAMEPGKSGAAPATVGGSAGFEFHETHRGMAKRRPAGSRCSTRESGDRPEMRCARGFVLRRVMRACRQRIPSAPSSSSVEAMPTRALRGGIPGMFHQILHAGIAAGLIAGLAPTGLQSGIWRLPAHPGAGGLRRVQPLRGPLLRERRLVSLHGYMDAAPSPLGPATAVPFPGQAATPVRTRAPNDRERTFLSRVVRPSCGRPR